VRGLALCGQRGHGLLEVLLDDEIGRADQGKRSRFPQELVLRHGV
jgi:hypothetical protein